MGLVVASDHNDSIEHEATDDDQRLWEEALRAIERADTSGKHSNTDTPHDLSTSDLQSLLYLPAYDRSYMDAIAGDEVLSYRQSGLSDRQAKKIFQYPFQAKTLLDLHHLPGQQAYDVCQYALVSSFINRHRKIRIICGFGHHNQGLSLMKGIAVMILQRANFVLAYQSADRRSGGTGAIDVYLKLPD